MLFLALFGIKLSSKVLQWWPGGLVGRWDTDCNATSGPQLTTDVESSSVKLVSWGQV